MGLSKITTQVKAVFFDIDDTLYMKTTDTLPESVIPALKKLKDAEIIVGIATGRVEAAFPEKIRHLIQEVGIDTLVTSNGQFVQCQGKVLRNAAIPNSIVKPVIDFFRKNQIDYAVINNDKLAVSARSPRVIDALDPITLNYQVDPLYYEDHPILQILSFTDESQDPLLLNSGVFSALKLVRWHPYSMDLFETSGSKARGIETVAQYLGFGMENVMAFGDGLNDLEMLSEVGFGIAMGNAHEELKPKADFITKAVYEDGIEHFLTKSGLIK